MPDLKTQTISERPSSESPELKLWQVAGIGCGVWRGGAVE
jgi:hypothetical protein